MKSLFVALLAIVLMTSTVDAAGLRMAPNDIKDDARAINVLADRIGESLARDVSGNQVIAGHPCATPNHYLEAIRSYHPSASLGSVGELPNYLRQLKYERGPSGTFPMSRILQTSSGCKLDLVGWTRSFRSGEGSWRDPNTGEIILAGDCGNVVGGPPPPRQVVEDCVEIPVAVLLSYQERHTVQIEIRPTLHVWGPRITGCGLQVIECYCVDPKTGKMAVAYRAPVVSGSGVVRIPRALAQQMEEICFMADGLWPPQGIMVHREMVIRDIRPLAGSASVVLPAGKRINFYQSEQKRSAG